MTTLWVSIGEALLVGRRLHKSDRAFGQWVQEVGFGDMKSGLRADVMWFALVYAERNPQWPTGVTDPTHLRQWHREQQKDNPELPSDLADTTGKAVPSTFEPDDRSSERIAKVYNRAKSGGEGADLAKKHIESIARKHGVTGILSTR